MPVTRHGLFPVYVDPPTGRCSASSSTSLASACSKLSLQASPSRPKRTIARRPALLAEKIFSSENDQPRRSVPTSLTKCKKPSTGLGYGRKTSREVLRDVSQEFECRGDEPEGFRLPTPPPSATFAKGSLQIFVDPSPSCAPSTAKAAGAVDRQSKPSSTVHTRSHRKPSSLTVYTSPPRKVVVIEQSSITGAVKRGRGLGGATAGLGGNVGRGLRA